VCVCVCVCVLNAQPIPEKTRLEMLVEMQIEIRDGQSSGLFSNEPFEKRPVMTISDFVLNSDDHFESHLLGNGLCDVCLSVCMSAYDRECVCVFNV